MAECDGSWLWSPPLTTPPSTAPNRSHLRAIPLPPPRLAGGALPPTPHLQAAQELELVPSPDFQGWLQGLEV